MPVTSATRDAQGQVHAAAARPAGPEPVLYRIPQVMRILSMSRSVIFEQLRAGRLRSVREGRTRLVPAAAIAEYVALLEREAAGESGR